MILDDIKAVLRTHLLPPEPEAWTEGLDMEAAALAVLHLFSPTMLEMERRIAELEAKAAALDCDLTAEQAMRHPPQR